MQKKARVKPRYVIRKRSKSGLNRGLAWLVREECLPSNPEAKRRIPVDRSGPLEQQHHGSDRRAGPGMPEARKPRAHHCEEGDRKRRTRVTGRRRNRRSTLAPRVGSERHRRSWLRRKCGAAAAGTRDSLSSARDPATGGPAARRSISAARVRQTRPIRPTRPHSHCHHLLTDSGTAAEAAQRTRRNTRGTFGLLHQNLSLSHLPPTKATESHNLIRLTGICIPGSRDLHVKRAKLTDRNSS